MQVAKSTVVDGDVVERGLHSDAIITPSYFDNIYFVLLTEIFIHYTIVCKEAQHFKTQVLNTINECTP